MRIGVMSDTHGNLEMMQQAADRMIDEFGAEAIVHLGDDYADALKINARARPVIAVPGVFEAAWNVPKIKRRVARDFGGVNFLLSHTPTHDSHDSPGDINPEFAHSKYDADVLLHGHTHHWRIEAMPDGFVAINPGHLKSEKDRGSCATFAIIDVANRRLKVKIVEMNGDVIEEKEINL